MKKPAAGLLLSIAAATSQAAIVSYDYTAVVNLIQVPTSDWPGYDWVSSTSEPGFYSEIGETVTGTFTYDTSTPVLGSDGTTAQYGENGRIVSSITFGGSGHQFTGTPATYMLVRDYQQGGDRVEILAPSAVGAPRVELELIFYGNSSSVLSSTAIPWTQFGAFEHAQVAYRFNDGDTIIYSNLTSLQMTSAVPEPASISLLLAGLGIVALGRRLHERRRAGRFTQ